MEFINNKTNMLFNIKSKLFYGVLALSAVASCKSGDKQQAASEVAFHGDTITVSAESPILSKIKIQTLAEEPFSTEFRTVGTVQAETGHYAEVCSPFDGRVTRSAVRLGQHVGAGQCLYEMSSADFVEASKTYFQAVRNCETAKANYDRKKTLFDHGIASQRELEEIRTEAENACHEKESAEATLRVYNVNPSQLKMGQSLRISSPIEGEVVACSITPGQFIKADSEPLVTVADLRKVWINALVKERFIGNVNQGEKVEIFTEAEPDSIIWGHIVSIGNMVDEETRSVQVILGCDNALRKLKHGMYVSVHFISESKSSIVLPATAIFQGEQHSYVFVAVDGKSNTFVRRDVEVMNGSDDRQKVCVLSGLQSGETIVSEGGLFLNE